MMDLKIKIMFTEEVLGSANNDQKIHDEFIASKAPDAQSREEEVAAMRKVVRGGAWHDRAVLARSAARSGYWPGQRVYQVGFRVVCE